ARPARNCAPRGIRKRHGRRSRGDMATEARLRAGLPPLWSEFPPAGLLYQDDDIIVIDKPWGLATHAPEKDRRDDVVSWLRASFEARGESDYLGIHQRLDRDTSGVLLFARRKEANRALAAELEG